jgi:hypothetical protein
VLVVVPLAVAAAVSAAIVHGIVGSGGSNKALTGGLVTDHNLGTPRAVARPKVAANAPQPDALSGLPTRGRLVHEDATLSVRVRDGSALTGATSRATRIVGSLGGWAQSVHYRTARDGSGSAFLDLRVPVGNVKKAVTRLGGLGTLVNEQISTQDLEQTLTKQSNRVASLRRTIAAYEAALADTTLPEAQRVILQVRLKNAKRTLATTLQARKGTVASGATANVSLTLTTRKAAAVVPHEQGRFGRMLHGAVGFLGLEGTIVLYALVVLSPVLAIGGLAWAVLRERRRRDERRLLAT